MKIYVSSTKADLEEYRKALIETIRRLGHEPVHMEHYGPDARQPAEKVQADVAACDIYVCIVAWRYGFIPKDSECSITELEYRKAVEQKLPMWVFLLDGDVLWKPKDIDGGEIGQRRIDKFRDQLSAQHTVSFFKGVGDLCLRATEEILKQGARIDPGARLAPPPRLQVSLSRLPPSSAACFGRERELEQMDEAWSKGRTNVLSIVAWGGVGKSALINRWLVQLANENYRGAERAFGWSFYDQEGHARETSADVFIVAALTWFGDANPTLGSLWDKGQRLAELVCRQRTILVLDGLEVLQQSSGTDEGQLKDPAMQALLLGLAWQNPGLCLITTRFEVADLKRFVNSTVEEIRLEHLTPEAGAELLASLGVRGTKTELRAASRECGGHALALYLLGGYLVSECEGDVRRRDAIALQESTGSRMDWYGAELGEGPATDLIRMLSLFNGPAHIAALNALLKSPKVPGLTANLSRPGDKVWNRALNKLRTWNLVSEMSQSRPDVIETHAMVRQHFSQQLREKHPAAWREAHNRLFDYYGQLAPEKPDSLDEIVHLFQAVAHGCQAERYQEAWEKVYWPRIRREYDGFSVLTLNAYGADLATLAHFFAEPYEEPVTSLDAVASARLCTEAAFDLRGLGRLDEALIAQRLGLEAHQALEEKWKDPGSAENSGIEEILTSSGYQKFWEGADAAGNLSELLVTVGELDEAVEVAHESIALAKQTDDQMEVATNLATLAAALNQRGEVDAAEERFREAEALQTTLDGSVEYLHKLPGYNYCDLLLSSGKFAEVKTRANAALQADVGTNKHYAVGLAYLALARAHTLETHANGSGDFTDAATNMELARQELRLAGHEEIQVRGRLASAELGRLSGEFSRAEAALEQAQESAVRGQMRLLQSDVLLEYARLYLAGSRIEEARNSLREARQRIQAMRYHRRDAEVRALATELGL